MNVVRRTLAGSVIALAVVQPTLAQDAAVLRAQAQNFFKPIPDSMPGAEQDSAAKVRLGEKLYFETALSINGTQSCNSCHRVDGLKAGVDNEPTSPGALGKRGDRNSPSVWNAGFHLAQFWDGRAPDLKEQAKGPILNPIEMGLPSEQAAIERLNSAGYAQSFKAVYTAEEQPLTYANVADAIAAFERTLVTEDRFDRFLEGDNKALSTAEQQGLQDFIGTGCIACHNGSLLGASSYQKMGMVNAYPNTHDLGRYAVTQQESDRFVFKVPSLRDIARTAPYFHDGKAATLEQAVKDMAWYQLGQKLSDQTVQSITTFLKSLDNTRTVPAVASEEM
jgi:cytochrome c peroxidase